MGSFLPRGHVTSRGRESCLHVVALGSISVSWRSVFYLQRWNYSERLLFLLYEWAFVQKQTQYLEWKQKGPPRAALQPPGLVESKVE